MHNEDWNKEEWTMEDWNMNDSLPMEDRTYVRVVRPKEYIYALNPFSGVRVMLPSEVVNGSYLLEGTAPPAGFSEIRTDEGVRWMVRTHDIEQINGQPIVPIAPVVSTDDDLFLEKVIKALKTPQAKKIISLAIREHNLAQQLRNIDQKLQELWNGANNKKKTNTKTRKDWR